MEVHRHSHLASGETHTSRKKWTHYFWEFLLLFLAVFCGFLAENQREHYIEKIRAKQYAQSLISDFPRKEFLRAPHEKPLLRMTSPGVVKDFAFMLEMDKENTILFTNLLRKYEKEAVALLNSIEKEYLLK